MFAARNENGKHRLCHRKGITIHGTKLSGTWEEIEFSSQAKAKACADELNRLYWKPYWKAYQKNEYPPCAWEMYDLIKKYCR